MSFKVMEAVQNTYTKNNLETRKKYYDLVNDCRKKKTAVVIHIKIKLVANQIEYEKACC